jgi:MFS family permease
MTQAGAPVAAIAGTGLQEWRRYPLLPFAAALGYATSTIHVYGLGPYIQPISESFGWSRTQVTIGLTIATLSQSLFSIPIGMLVDRFGARPLGMLGVLVMPAAFAFIGTATGDPINWYLLWGLLAFAALFVQSTIWSSAVAANFTLSRGLALAVSLCGASAAGAFFPLLGQTLISKFGWQQAMMLHGAIWIAIAAPIIFFFFHDSRSSAPKHAEAAGAEKVKLAGVGLIEGLRSWTYWRLLLTCLLFTFTNMALVVHLVPILTDRGMDPIQAAGIAALVGLVSIAGRLGTGVLLDRFRGSLIGAVALLLPAVACLLLLGGDASPAVAMLVAALIGLTMGAEIDVFVYLSSRHFGLRNFGALYGGLMIALSVGTAIGPLLAARIFDLNGDYSFFLWLTIPCMIAGSLMLFSLPKPPPLQPGAEP